MLVLDLPMLVIDSTDVENHAEQTSGFFLASLAHPSRHLTT